MLVNDLDESRGVYLERFDRNELRTLDSFRLPGGLLLCLSGAYLSMIPRTLFSKNLSSSTPILFGSFLLSCGLFLGLSGCAEAPPPPATGQQMFEPGPTPPNPNSPVMEPQAGPGVEPSMNPEPGVGPGMEPSMEPGMEPSMEPGPAEPEAPPEPIVPEPDFPDTAAGVETVLASDQIEAGATLRVVCQLVDAQGNPLESRVVASPSYITSPSDSLEPHPEFDDALVPVRAGNATVTCSLPELGFVDSTPAALTIVPGPPQVTTAQAANRQFIAGEQTDVTCQVYDDFGNLITNANPALRLEPTVPGNSLEIGAVRVTKAGLYTVACDIEGADEITADTFEVLPALPAALLAQRSPDQEVYGIGQTVGIETSVLDRFGNSVLDAPVQVTVQPSAMPFGQNRYQFDQEGTYLMTARVTGPTEDGLRLQSQLDVTVNGLGPQIQCTSPMEGAMLDMAPGNTVQFTGLVNDANGVQSVRVNGNLATTQPDGTFSTSIATRLGVNFVDIVATDNFGEENTRTCAFLVSDDWIASNEYYSDSIQLQLNQQGIDDANRDDGIDSLDDLLHTVLNSQGLRNQLHQSLLNANPLFPNQCVQEVCAFGGCACIYRLEAVYRNLRVDGPNNVSMRLVNGGIVVDATVRGIEVDVDLGGTLSTSGTARLDNLALELTFDLDLVNGRPNISVRNIGRVEVGTVSTDFSGAVGFIAGFLVDLFNGSVRNLLRDQIQSFILDNFDQVLDGVVSGLDISSLGASFNVPRLDGNGTINLGFGIEFSSLETNAQRALFGIGTRFTGGVSNAGQSLGAPLAPGSQTTPSPSSNSAALVYVSTGVLNQALHTLWRAGLFDADLGGALLGEDAGVEVSLQAGLPPVATLGTANDTVEVMLGSFRMDLTYPQLFAEPIRLYLGAVATTQVTLVGEDELRFSNVTVSELIFSTDTVAINGNDRTVLNNFLQRLVQRVVDDSLNSALPALPIPAFAVPNTLSAFGLPQGLVLGIRQPSLSNSTATNHFVLEGNFGEQ